MIIGTLIKTPGISRAIVTAFDADANRIQIDNDPDWIDLSEVEQIGTASPEDWLALVMVKQSEIARADKKIATHIVKCAEHDESVKALNDKIAAQHRLIQTAEDRGRRESAAEIERLKQEVSSALNQCKSLSDANNQARAKLAAFEHSASDPDLKILTFFDDPIYRESTLQVERHLSEGARLLDLTVAPVTTVIDGTPTTRLCRVFTLQKRITKPQPAAQPSSASVLTADYVRENLPIAQHIRENGADDALDLMDDVATHKIKSRIASSLADPIISSLLITRPLLPASVQ